MVEYQSYPEAYADLANGRLDYVINAVISVNDLVKARPGVFEKGEPVSGNGFVNWPVPKNNPKLLAFMNGFVKHLKESGKLQALQTKWFGESFDALPDDHYHGGPVPPAGRIEIVLTGPASVPTPFCEERPWIGVLGNCCLRGPDLSSGSPAPRSCWASPPAC